MSNLQPFSLSQLPHWSAAEAQLAPVRARWFAAIANPVNESLTQLLKTGVTLSLDLDPPNQHQVTCGGIDDSEFVFICIRDGNAVKALVRVRTSWLRQVASRLLPMPSKMDLTARSLHVGALTPPTSVERSVAGLLVAMAIQAAAPHRALHISLSAAEMASAADMSWFAAINIVSIMASDVCDVFVSQSALRDLSRVDRREERNHWHISSHVAIGACRLARPTLALLARRDVVTLQAINTWSIGSAAIPVAINHPTNPSHATIEMGYIPNVNPALPASTTIELTATVGVQAMPLSRLSSLAAGDVIELRQSVQSVDLRVDGHVIGQGELLNVDGELAVRVVSLRP
jgi:flagellar motor switch/type III secretory pathway protein FliN